MYAVILPPAAALEAAARELADAAAGNTRTLIALNKGLYDLLIRAPQIVRISGAYLVPSTSTGGTVYRIDDVNGCSCPSGAKGNTCRHAQQLAIIEQAQTRVMPALTDRIAAARRAQAASVELFG